MTREEAIKIITNLPINIGRQNGKHLIQEALNMASEALEQCEMAYEHGWTDAESEYREILERKHGEWIYKQMKGQFCSVCDMQSVWKYNYCPNCGADMRERRENESIH